MTLNRLTSLTVLAGILAGAYGNSSTFTSEPCEEHQTMEGALLQGISVEVADSPSCHEKPVGVTVNGYFHESEAEFIPNLLVEMRAEGVLLEKKELPICSSTTAADSECVKVDSTGKFDITMKLGGGERLPRAASRTVDAFLVSPSTHVVGCLWGRLTFAAPTKALQGSIAFTKEEVEALYKRWVEEHGEPKTGSSDRRLAAFEQNLYEVASHNRQSDPSFELALNQFATHSPDEYRELLGFRGGAGAAAEVSRRLGADRSEEAKLAALPKEWDWVAKGAVTPVKNQGQCGSCWSFSATGAMEGAYFLKTGKLVSFSEQQMVSCDHVDMGCGGGLMDNAFKWIEGNGGLCTEGDYPYVSGTGAAPGCRKSGCAPVPGTVPKSFQDVKRDSEASMMETVTKQPVAIAIEADQLPFQFYRKGVLKRWCGTRLDHGVLLVGYGNYEATGMDYWKVKNSWGPTWGAKGYLLIQRGKHQDGGECGILLSGSVPEL